VLNGTVEELHGTVLQLTSYLSVDRTKGFGLALRNWAAESTSAC
jgi:hypothetical protein